MPQPEWDKMMKQCSALIIRGEESMSRACLSGIPFIWQAYPQSEEYQLVKVKALLERMRGHFDEDAFAIVEKAWMSINSMSLSGLTRQSHYERDSRVKHGNDSVLASWNDSVLASWNDSVASFLNTLPSLRPGFLSFAQSLQKNGDLCTNLMTFINKIAIM